MKKDWTKRFLVFAGSDYYPSGGAEDFVSSYDSLGEARENFEIIQENACFLNWWHVVDRDTGVIYEEGVLVNDQAP